jgi:hypothetical protein
MRNLSIALLLLPVALTACAGKNPTSPTASRIDELRASCEARGGMLVPSGRITGQEALDYPCVIRGATTLPPAR